MSVQNFKHNPAAFPANSTQLNVTFLTLLLFSLKHFGHNYGGNKI